VSRNWDVTSPQGRRALIDAGDAGDQDATDIAWAAWLATPDGELWQALGRWGRLARWQDSILAKAVLRALAEFPGLTAQPDLPSSRRMGERFAPPAAYQVWAAPSGRYMVVGDRDRVSLVDAAAVALASRPLTGLTPPDLRRASGLLRDPATAPGARRFLELLTEVLAAHLADEVALGAAMPVPDPDDVGLASP
jgi:hypothetical protein